MPQKPAGQDQLDIRYTTIKVRLYPNAAQALSAMRTLLGQMDGTDGYVQPCGGS